MFTALRDRFYFRILKINATRSFTVSVYFISHVLFSSSVKLALSAPRLCNFLQTLLSNFGEFYPVDYTRVTTKIRSSKAIVNRGFEKDSMEIVNVILPFRAY